jgi:hypothetical protein
MREKYIENYLVNRVRLAGGEVRKVRWVGRRGAPDRFIMLPNRIVWVELKAPGKAAQPYQLREHERMRRYGLDVVVIDSIEAIEKLVKE